MNYTRLSSTRKSGGSKNIRARLYNRFYNRPVPIRDPRLPASLSPTRFSETRPRLPKIGRSPHLLSPLFFVFYYWNNEGNPEGEFTHVFSSGRSRRSAVLFVIIRKRRFYDLRECLSVNIRRKRFAIVRFFKVQPRVLRCAVLPFSHFSSRPPARRPLPRVPTPSAERPPVPLAQPPRAPSLGPPALSPFCAAAPFSGSNIDPDISPWFFSSFVRSSFPGVRSSLFTV